MVCLSANVGLFSAKTGRLLCFPTLLALVLLLIQCWGLFIGGLSRLYWLIIVLKAAIFLNLFFSFFLFSWDCCVVLTRFLQLCSEVGLLIRFGV